MAASDEAEAEATEEDAESGEAIAMSRDIGFEFIIERGTLEDFLDAAQAVGKESTLKINEEGLSTGLIDATSAYSGEVVLHPDAFEHYEATRTRVGMNLKKFSDAIEFADKTDLVHVAYDEETRRVTVKIEGTELDLAGIDPDAIRAAPDMPDLALPVNATVPSGLLKRVLKMAKFVDDTGALTFTHDEDAKELRFSMSEYDDSGTHTEDTDDIPEFDAAGNAESMISVDFLDSAVTSMPSAADIHMELGVEKPLVLEFETADGYCEILYMIAPRIQSE